MNYKKGLIAGLVYYAIMYIFVDMLMFTFGLGQQVVGILAMVIGIILIYLVGKNYYFSKKPKNFLKEGFVYGLYLFIVTIILEILLMVYAHAKELGWGWFTQPEMVAFYVIIFIAAIVTAKLK